MAVQGQVANRVAKGAGLKHRLSACKCYALSTQTFWAISACYITLLLSAVLNKDCVYSGLTCCLGGEPSGSQVAAINRSSLLI